MHGLVHRSLKQYVLEKTDESAWSAVRERAGVEEKLYLPVTRYEDREFDAILESLAALSGHDRAAVERDVGYYLAEPLLATYRTHVREDWDLEALLDSLEAVVAEINEEPGETDPPTLTCRRVGGDVRVVYRSNRDYRSLAHGILEGVVDAYDPTATVRAVPADDSDEACAFVVDLDGE